MLDLIQLSERRIKMSLPSYFQQGETSTELFHSVGDRVYGVLCINKNVVRYTFNDGSRSYTDERRFNSDSSAEKFASKFAAEMNRCWKRNSVPTSATFRNF